MVAYNITYLGSLQFFSISTGLFHIGDIFVFCNNTLHKKMKKKVFR